MMMNDQQPVIATVIPAYQAEAHIASVLAGIPDCVSHIIVVDDCSPDRTGEIARSFPDSRICLIQNPKNMGVGGSTLRGYQAACEFGADVIVKMDSDGQMDPAYLIPLITPILQEKADYTKGNRFMHLRHLHQMPLLRRIGNFGLSFLSKLASGYWNIFDPSNGYTAINAKILPQLDLAAIHPRYFFETSMLLELGLQRVIVADIYIPSKYGEEKSSLSELDSLVRFPGLLIQGFLKRFFIQYFIRDFSAVTLFVLGGIPLLLFGFLFGVIEWIHSSLTGIPATTGTVMLSVLPFILGSQFLLQAIVMDIQNVPGKNTHG